MSHTWSRCAEIPRTGAGPPDSERRKDNIHRKVSGELESAVAINHGEWKQGNAVEELIAVKIHFLRKRVSVALTPVYASLCALAQTHFPAFEEQIVNPDAEVVLAVDVADINNDGKPDIVGVSDSYVAWYENPAWTKHLISGRLKGGNVCVAIHDLDGDGTPEMAVGADWQFNNTESGGALYFLKSADDVKQPWTATLLMDPVITLHRIRWADPDGDGRQKLVVAPLKGRGSTPPNHLETGARLFLLRPPADPVASKWGEELISDSLHLMHNVWPMREADTKKDTILAASIEGVTAFTRDASGSWSNVNLTESLIGQPTAPGAGEIKSTLRTPVMHATIEPWHGNHVVVYAPRGKATTAEFAYQRHVLDDTYKGGHAVWWADFDGDGDEDLLAGYRERSDANGTYGLYVYALDHDLETGGLSAVKHAVDVGGMATEDALAADLNGDGRPDIVAGGRATHNIKCYLNQGR
ncbi:MAG: hypothetical protein AMXMBFR4_21250 [Candidatus Hydrogenedentota bacterium]